MDFLSSLSLTQVLIVAFLVLLFFGGKRLTEFSKGLGESTRELKKAGKELSGKGKQSSSTNKKDGESSSNASS